MVAHLWFHSESEHKCYMLQTTDSCRHSKHLESLFFLCLASIKGNIKVTCKPVFNGVKIVSQTDLSFLLFVLELCGCAEKPPDPMSCEEGWLLLFMDSLREEGKRELEKGLETS